MNLMRIIIICVLMIKTIWSKNYDLLLCYFFHFFNKTQRLFFTKMLYNVKRYNSIETFVFKEFVNSTNIRNGIFIMNSLFFTCLYTLLKNINTFGIKSFLNPGERRIISTTDIQNGFTIR